MIGYPDHTMTVGDLRATLADAPDDAAVLVVINTLSGRTLAASGADYIAESGSFINRPFVQIVLAAEIVGGAATDPYAEEPANV